MVRKIVLAVVIVLVWATAAQAASTYRLRVSCSWIPPKGSRAPVIVRQAVVDVPKWRAGRARLMPANQVGWSFCDAETIIR